MNLSTLKRNKSRLLVGVLMAFIIVLVSLNILSSHRQKSVDAEGKNIPRAIQSSDHLIGEKKAPITLFVYTDFSCPYCRAYHLEAIPRLQAEFGANIALVYRHYPLETIHPRARREAEASECVFREKGDAAFWAFVTSLFLQPNLEAGVSDELLVKFAQAVGADKSAFTACLTSEAESDRVQEDVLEGLRLGISKTPSTIVYDGETPILVSGAGFHATEAAVKLLLEKAR